jgi:hypothetical protein
MFRRAIPRGHACQVEENLRNWLVAPHSLPVTLTTNTWHIKLRGNMVWTWQECRNADKVVSPFHFLYFYSWFLQTETQFFTFVDSKSYYRALRNLPAALGPGVYSASDRNEYRKHWKKKFLWIKVRPLLFFQVATQLYSQGWVDPVPDPLFPRKSSSARNRTRTSESVAWNSNHQTTEAVLYIISLHKLHTPNPSDSEVKSSFHLTFRTSWWTAQVNVAAMLVKKRKLRCAEVCGMCY